MTLLITFLSILTVINCKEVIPKYYKPKIVLQQKFQNTCPLDGDRDDIFHATRSKISEDIQDLLYSLQECNLGECEENPALSCDQISTENPSSASGDYWIRAYGGNIVKVHCAMTEIPCGCSNSNGAWTRIAFLNMSDPNTICPHGMEPITRDGVRACKRSAQQTDSCLPAFLSTNCFSYNRVCGRIVGYQEGTPDAFHRYFVRQWYTLDDPYMDGVSVTYGFSPRKHIWSFVAGLDANGVGYISHMCPCTRPYLWYTGIVPPFIGEDWFCETASENYFQFGKFYPENPLWDGVGCSDQSTCCDLHSPPWFCKELQQPTRDNIEVRVCHDEGVNNENVALGLIELYVQ